MHLYLKNLNCHKKSSHQPTKNSQRTLHYDSLELEFVNSLRNGFHIFRILNVQKFSFKFIGGLWILNNVALDEWEKVCGAGPGSGELSSAARVDLWLVRVPSVPASLGPGTLARSRDTGEASSVLTQRRGCVIRGPHGALHQNVGTRSNYIF